MRVCAILALEESVLVCTGVDAYVRYLFGFDAIASAQSHGLRLSRNSTLRMRA